MSHWKVLFSKSSALLVIALFAIGSKAQEPSPSQTPLPKDTLKLSRGSSPAPAEPVSADPGGLKVRKEADSEEEAAILPYYNNYLREYHLGPEDVISVEVFGQANYSKSNIVIPPNAKISYPLIPGGVFVGGKTVEQVGEEIKKKLDEYIIDPQVTVTLDKVGSARYSILGKVTNPGVKVMNRRYNLFEAIAEAGGIDKLGDKKRVLLLRLNASNGFTQTVIDLDKAMKGSAEVPYLVPGDQIIIPEKRWSLTRIVGLIGQVSAFRILFGSPF